MAEKPILFSTDMVQAILSGRKTMTRRVVKHKEELFGAPTRFQAYQIDDGHHRGKFGFSSEDEDCVCPYGRQGDLLWVKETHFAYGRWVFSGSIGGKTKWSFQADENEPVFFCDDFPDVYEFETGISTKIGYYKRPSIFMFKEYARIWLRVTGLRVERLQDITEADAMAEGAPEVFDNSGNKISDDRTEFIGLWDRINFKRGYGWDKNPWVWVVEFERVDRQKTDNRSCGNTECDEYILGEPYNCNLFFPANKEQCEHYRPQAANGQQTRCQCEDPWPFASPPYQNSCKTCSLIIDASKEEECSK